MIKDCRVLVHPGFQLNPNAALSASVALEIYKHVLRMECMNVFFDVDD